MRYIGGEIEFEDQVVQQVNDQLELIHEKYLLYSTGRTALKYLLRYLSPSKPVLLPSYACESITQPFKELGISYEFYRVNKDLTIDLKFLWHQLESNDYGAFYFINYFGFATNPEHLRQIKQGRESIVLIEDSTHSTFIPNEAGQMTYSGDFAYGSLRKTLPLSDGAFILKNDKHPIESATVNDTGFSRLKHHGKTLRRYFLSHPADEEVERTYLDLLSIAEEQIAATTPETDMSVTALVMLGELDFSHILRKRRENYGELYGKLSSDKEIGKLGYCIRDISENEMPYMLPFYITNGERNRLRSLLREMGVFVSIIWGEMPQVDEVLYKDTAELGKNILCFPIDQRYGVEDMNFIYTSLKKVANAL